MISPCIGICSIDKSTRMCYGCYRMIEEISKWSKFTDSERDNIMNILKERKNGIFTEKAPNLPKG